MLSLANAFDKEDLVNFEKIMNYLNQKDPLKLNKRRTQNRWYFCFIILQKWQFSYGFI